MMEYLPLPNSKNNTPLMAENTYLTTEEVAKLLNVHSNTVARWIKSGKLPSTKIGREYRIPREAIENRVNRVASGTRIIAVANQKGGVAKTTSTLNLAAGLAARGKRVLVVDLDPQGGSGVSLGVATDSLNKTVYNVLISDEVGFPDIIMKTKFGFDLAPSNIDLAGAEIELKQLLASEQILKRKLEEILDDYDYVLLDCPPSLGMLPTKYDKTTLNSKEIYTALQTSAHNAGIRVFNTYIPLTVRITESPRFKTPIIVQLPNHEGAAAYQTVVEEIINGKQ